MEQATAQNHSPDMAPVLARLNAAYALYRDSREQRPMARVQLTGVVSDLMALDLSQSEVDMVADVLIALARQAETDLRKAMAERLSAMDDIPVRLVMQMANDEISVARPVLRESPVLGDAELSDIINAKGSEHWEAIAGRKTLSDVIINKLADTGDFPTATTLAENIAITLTDHAIGALSEMARESEVLAQPLLRRAEVPDGVASQLYRSVGQTLKKFILKNYEVDTDALMETLDDVVLEFVERADAAQEDVVLPAAVSSAYAHFLPSASMIRAAAQFKTKGLLTVQLMLNTLRRGQIASFVAQFASYCGMEAEDVCEVLHQRRAKGLAIACRASGVGRPDFVSVYLLTNVVRNVGQSVDLKELGGTLGIYDRTPPDTARAILAQSLDKLLSDG